MDLTTAFPRSPKEKLAGLVHVPRMSDKARAYKDHTLGEYIFPCPLDEMILDFLQVDSGEFARHAVDDSDTEFSRWVAELCRHRNREDKEGVNRQILERSPDDDEKKKYFRELRDAIDPSRTDIVTWVDLIDLEEGRI